MLLHSLPRLLSETDSYSSILYSSDDKGEITWCACGCPTRYLRAGHNNCIPMCYRTNRFIVALAQIQPPHCTISCLASCSAILFLHLCFKYMYTHTLSHHMQFQLTLSITIEQISPSYLLPPRPQTINSTLCSSGKSSLMPAPSM